MKDNEGAGGAKTYTQDEVDALIDERLADLKDKVDEFRTTNVDLMKKLKAYDGVDADGFKAMKARLDELENQRKAGDAGITAEELKQLRAEVREELLTGEFGEYKSQAEALSAEVRELRLDAVVKGHMAKAGVRSERIDALFRLTADQFDLTDDGEPMLKDRRSADVGKYVADELRKEYPEFYNGSGASGGGASKSAAGGGGGVPRTIAAHDGDAFMANLEAIAKGEVVVTQ